MDKNLQNIEDLFRFALEDNEDELPGDDGWEAVEKRLDQDHIIRIKRKYFTLKKIAAVLLLFLCAALYQLVSKKAANSISGENEKNIAFNDTYLPSQPVPSPNKENKGADDLAKSTESALSMDKSDSLHNPLVTTGKQSSIDTAIQKTNTIINAPDKKILTNESAAGFLANQQKKHTVSHQHTTIENGEISSIDEESQLAGMDGQKPANQSKPRKRLENILAEKAVTTEPRVANQKELKNLLSEASRRKSLIDDAANSKNKNIAPKAHDKVGRFSISPFFSLDIARNSLGDDKHDSQQGNAHLLEKSEKHQLSNTAGFWIHYKINKNWGLFSGLAFLHTNISMEPTVIYALPDNMGNIKYRINTSSGYGYLSPASSPNPANGDSLLIFNATHRLRYISLPAGITYTKSFRKVDVTGQIGISVNILTGAILKTSIQHGSDKSDETVTSLHGLKNGYLSGLTGLGIDYNLSHNKAITVAPVLRFAISSVTKDYTVTSYPMSLGLGVGLKFRL